MSAAWRALFLNLPLWKDEPTTPWLRTSRRQLAIVGPDEFTSRLYAWSVSLAEQSPIRVSAAGAEILKSLLWHLGLLPSSSTEQALSAFRRVHYQRSCLSLAEKVDRAVARLAVTSTSDAKPSPEIQ